jgi:hypothetical protein
VGSWFTVRDLTYKRKHTPLSVWVSKDVFKNVFRVLEFVRRRFKRLVCEGFRQTNVSLAPA